MTKRLFILSLAVAFVSNIIGCSRPDEITGPQPEVQISASPDLSLVSFVASSHFDLTPEQKEKLEAAMKRHHEAVKALMEKLKSGAITREEFQRELQKLEEQLEDEIKSILTPEQYEKWKEHQKFVRQNGGLPYPLPLPLEHLARMLELNEDQIQKAKGIVEQAQKDIRAAVTSINDPRELRHALEGILKRADAQFRSILTEEQARKYEQIKRSLHHHQPPYPLPVPLEHLVRALSLTPEQVQQARAIVEQGHKDIRAAMESIKDPAELRQALEAILKRVDAQFTGILTEEQATKYQQIKRGMHQPGPPYPLPIPLEHLVRALELTPDQIEKAKAIVEQGQKDIRAAFESIKDPNELRTALQGILKRSDEQFHSILTEEQARKYEQIKKGMHQNRYPYPLPFPLEVLVRELQLTPEQVEKARAIVAQGQRDIHRAVDSIRDPHQLRRVIEDIMMRTDRQFRSILSDQQAAKYEEMKRNRRGSSG